MNRVRAFAVGVAAVALSFCALAQDYPTRTVSLLVPFAAGGPTDIVARTLAVGMGTVPYKGTAPAMNDIMGGQVDLLCDQTTQTTSYITSGRVKAYGATSKTRVDSLKDLPTLHEAGLPGFEVVVWHGLYAPKGTPKPVLDKLQAALQSAIGDDEFVQKMNGLGSQVVTKDKATPDGLRTRLTSEIGKWTPIIKKAGVYAD